MNAKASVPTWLRDMKVARTNQQWPNSVEINDYATRYINIYVNRYIYKYAICRCIQSTVCASKSAKRPKLDLRNSCKAVSPDTWLSSRVRTSGRTSKAKLWSPIISLSHRSFTIRAIEDSFPLRI